MNKLVLIETLREYGIATLEDLLDLLEYSFDAITLNDKNSKLIYASKAIERISGMSRDSLLSTTPEQLMKKGIILNKSSKRIAKGVYNTNHVLHTGTTAFITSCWVPHKLNPNDYLILSNYREIQELQDLADELRKVRNKSVHYNNELMKLKSKSALNGIIAHTKSMEHVVYTVSKIAQADITVNITGESGVGKNVIAKLIHDLSNRKDGPYIHINCGAIPENLMESELFGYESGAFSGASGKGKPGLLEIAHKGTVFLDEVADLPLNLQVKLLKVLEDHKISRIGSTKTIDLDLRIVCASNKNMLELVNNGTFRSDLYYRINHFPLNIPPLRERIEEIVQFSHHFLNKFNVKYNTNKSISKEVLRILESYDWPGNIRELESLVERLVLISDKNKIKEKDLPEKIVEHYYDSGNHQTLKEYMDKHEKNYIQKTVRIYGSRNSAKVLGIDYSTLKRKMKKHRKGD